MWRLVHQWSFLLFWLPFDCFWRLVHCWYSLGTPVTIGTLVVPTVYQSSKTVINSQKTVKTVKMTISVPIVTCLHTVRRIHKVRVRRPRPRPPNTQSPYRSSIKAVALNCLVFLENCVFCILASRSKMADLRHLRF